MWWDAPAPSRPMEQGVVSSSHSAPSPPSSLRTTAAIGAPASAVALMQRNFLVGVTMRSREMWVNVNAATVDELCAKVEAEMCNALGLTYMELLYLTCTTDAASGGGTSTSPLRSATATMKRQKSFAGTDDSRLFSMCARHRRAETERTLQRKGRTGRVPLIHDDANPDDVHEALGESKAVVGGRRNIVFTLPPKFSCVARCIPRSIHFTVYCVLTPRVRLAFSPSRGAPAAPEGRVTHFDAVPSTDRDIIFRVPSPAEEEALMHDGGSELVCVRGVAQDVTSLTEFSTSLVGALRQAIADRDSVDSLSQSMSLYFFNPRDKYTTHRCYVPLLHVAQLSGLTSILCDAVGEGNATVKSATSSVGAIRSIGQQRPAPSVALQVGSGAVLQALKQRLAATRQRHEASPLPSAAVRSPPSNPLNARADVEAQRQPAARATPSPTIASPSSQNSNSLRSDHLHRLGIPTIADEKETGDHNHPHLAKRREELYLEDGVRDHEVQQDDHQRYTNSIAGDALVESKVRFPYDLRTSQWRVSGDCRRDGGGASTPTPSSYFLSTPPPHFNGDALSNGLSSPSTVTSTTSVALGSSGRIVLRREAATPAEEKRALIQITLHMLLSHPKRGMFPTSNLVTLIPTIVQSFRQQYAPGVPLRFPLSQRDTQDLNSVVDDCVAYEMASNPNLPFLLEQSSPQRQRQVSRLLTGSPTFSETDVEAEVNADVPPMVDRLPSAPPSAQSILILTKPFYEPRTKRLLVYATVGVDIFDGASSALHQSTRPYHSSSSPPRPQVSSATAMSNGMASLPFRWFLRTAPSTYGDASRELPIETFFALGLATTQVMSYSVPITVSLELHLNANQDWSYIAEGQERVLVHRWRAGGVANILEEGQSYVVGVEIRRPDVPQEIVGARGEYVQATQAFVIPLDSGIAPATREELYGMLNE